MYYRNDYDDDDDGGGGGGDDDDDDDDEAANCRHHAATSPPPSCDVSVVCDDSASVTERNPSPSEAAVCPVRGVPWWVSHSRAKTRLK